MCGGGATTTGGAPYGSQYGVQYGQMDTPRRGPKPWGPCPKPCPPCPPCPPPCPLRPAYPGTALVTSSRTSSPSSTIPGGRVPVVSSVSPIALPFLLPPSAGPGRR